MNRILRNTLIGLAGLATLSGCTKDKDELPKDLEGNFSGYPVKVRNMGDVRTIRIEDPEHPRNLFILGTDYFNRDGEGVDEIQIYVLKTNELMHYANPDSLNAACQAVLKQYREQGDNSQ